MLGEEVFSIQAHYKYTVVLDGANVGYYKTNYDGHPPTWTSCSSTGQCTAAQAARTSSFGDVTLSARGSSQIARRCRVHRGSVEARGGSVRDAPRLQ